MKKSLLLVFAFIFMSSCAFSTESTWDIKENLSEKQTYNLMMLAKVYGCARYFYPNYLTSEWDDVDWYKYLAIASERVLDVNDEETLKQTLLEFFSPIIPELKFDSIDTDQNIATSKSDNKIFYAWEHYGFGTRPIENIFESKIKSFNSYSQELPVPDSLYKIKLAEDMYMYYPISITYKHKKSAAFKKVRKQMSKKKLKLLDISETHYIFNDIFNKPNNHDINFIRDVNIRLADIIVKWNIVRHFYPYYVEDNLSDKWESALIAALENASSCNDQNEYYNVVRRLFSHVNDSHISVDRFVRISNLLGVKLPYFTGDLILDWIDKEIYLDEIPANALNSSLNRGDVLVSINGISIDSVVKEKCELISSSTLQGKYESLIHWTLLESFKYSDTLHIEVLNRDNQIITLPVITNKPFQISGREVDSDFISEMSGIYYINLVAKDDSMATYQQFKRKLSEMKNAKGIILDIRGYPNYTVADSIIVHFKKDSIQWGDFRRPTRYYPFQENVSYKENRPFLHTTDDILDVPVCVLINHKAMSYAETLIGIIKENNIGILIGQPTIGTNGDVTMIRNPIFGFTMTAIKDFSGFHGKGIQPDILVHPNLDSIRANRDEILETAKKYIYELEIAN